MTYLAACLICVAAIELFVRLPFLKQVARLGEIGRKTKWVIGSSRISDHWKEKVLQRYSRDMAVCSITLGLYMAIVLGVVTVLAIAFDTVVQPDMPTLEYFMSTEGLLLTTAFAFMYVFVRRRLVAS
jgi:hypothetical protein